LSAAMDQNHTLPTVTTEGNLTLVEPFQQVKLLEFRRLTQDGIAWAIRLEQDEELIPLIALHLRL
jgi:hypothetical protein